MTAADGEAKSFTGFVGVEGNRITMVTSDGARVDEFRRRNPGYREIDCRGKVVMPGLINTHSHVAMTLQRSAADDIPLMRWLNEHIWPFEARQSVGEVQTGMELGIVEMLLGGTTSVVDMYYHEESCVEVVRRMGIRAMLGCNYFDTNIDEVLPQIERAVALSKSDSRIKVAVAPHAPYTVSEENLVRGKALAERLGLHFMTHLSETEDEIRYVREKFGCTPTEHYDRLGLLTPKTIAAHCVHLTESDRATLRDRGVTVSHNPQSNMKISSGIAPVEQLNREGALVTIATDGACSNNDLDMWEEMRSAAFLQKVATGNPLALPAYEVLKMATVNGARAMGCEGELGVIAEGALADIVVIDLRKPHLQPLYDVVSTLVYCGKAADVETVMVDGRILVDGHRIEGVDLGELYARAAAAVERITAK